MCHLAWYLQHLGMFTFHFAWNFLHVGVSTFHFVWDLPHFGMFTLHFAWDLLHVGVFTFHFAWDWPHLGMFTEASSTGICSKKHADAPQRPHVVEELQGKIKQAKWVGLIIHLCGVVTARKQRQAEASVMLPWNTKQ